MVGEERHLLNLVLSGWERRALLRSGINVRCVVHFPGAHFPRKNESYSASATAMITFQKLAMKFKVRSQNMAELKCADSFTDYNWDGGLFFVEWQHGGGTGRDTQIFLVDGHHVPLRTP